MTRSLRAMTRVLVLDDDAASAELMRLVLEDAGYTTCVRGDARDLPGGRAECLVTDLVGVTPYSLEGARQLVAGLRDRYPGVPIVVVTAHAAAERDADRLGSERVIIKPFDIDQLLAAIEAATMR